jgi:hypothetical protein
VNLFKRVAAWLDRVTTRPPPAALPNILTDGSVKRDYRLYGDDHDSSTGYQAEWTEFPSEIIEAFVKVFNLSCGWEWNVPYVQFYASSWSYGNLYAIDLPGCNIGRIGLARGKIRPSETSEATLNDDGSVTFTDVSLELTINGDRDAPPLVVASITITATGELVVTETDE